MDSTDAALERLCDPEIEVSAHYLISETGVIYQLVQEDKRAWHAGAGQWGAVMDVNSHSIGIELANTGFAPFPEPQMTALEAMLADLLDRHAISPDRVIGHSDMAPGRKGDPGRRFDWQRLARQGLAVWPDRDEVDLDLSFAQAAVAFGYPRDCDEESVLGAVRLRFAPWKSGPCDANDQRMINNLARRFPVDQATSTT